MSTFVVSDLHGYSEVFERGLDHINFSDSDSLYVIGDVIDRGPDGIKLLQMIHDNPNMDLLIGNHELLMLCSVALDATAQCTGNRTDLWLEYNGGMSTFEKYCKLPKEIRKQLLEWLYERKLITQLEVNDKKFVLLHSFYNPYYAEASYCNIPKRDAWNIVWESIFRGDRYIITQASYTNYSDLIFITGHVPVQRISPMEVLNGDLPKPYRVSNLIDIDGGLAAGKNGLVNGAIFYKLEDETYYVEPFERS